MEATSSGNHPAYRIWSPVPVPKRGDFPLGDLLYFRFCFWLLNGSSRRNHKVSKSAALAGQHSTQGRRPTCMRQLRTFTSSATMYKKAGLPSGDLIKQG